MDTTDGFLTPLEAAKLLSVSRMTIYRLVDRGEIPAVRIGRQIRIPSTSLALALQSTRTGPDRQ